MLFFWTEWHGSLPGGARSMRTAAPTACSALLIAIGGLCEHLELKYDAKAL